MIADKENAKYLTDAQWLILMQIVRNREMLLRMPKDEGLPAELVYEDTHYTIHSNGIFDIEILSDYLANS